MSSITESMPRRPQPRLLGAAAGAVLAAAAVVAVVLLLTSGSGGAAAHHELRYGGLPSWLPQAEPVGERIVTASAAHPALAIQGDTVAVDLAGGGKVLATVVGPEVPEEGQVPVPETSPCTFVLTLAEGSRTVPIAPGDFIVTDEYGNHHRVRLTGMDGGPPPTKVPAGRTVSLKLHGVYPTGNGSLAWSPAASKPLVGWDFVVEID